MKWNRSMFIRMTVLCCIAISCFVGCESDDDPTPVAVAGTWRIVDSDGDTSTLKLNQDNNTLTGTLASGGSTVPLSAGSQMSGANMTIVVIVGDVNITLRCTASTTTLSNGTFTDSTGSSGTFTGTKQ